MKIYPVFTVECCLKPLYIMNRFLHDFAIIQLLQNITTWTKMAIAMRYDLRTTVGYTILLWEKCFYCSHDWLRRCKFKTLVSTVYDANVEELKLSCNAGCSASDASTTDFWHFLRCLPIKNTTHVHAKTYVQVIIKHVF